MESAVRKYETVIVFNSTLGEAQVKDESAKIQQLLASNGAEDISINNWGKKELAHHMKKQKFGSYVAFNYRAPGNTTNQAVTGVLRIAENVLRFQTHVISDRVRKFKGNTKRKTSAGSSFGGEFEGVEGDY